MIPYAPSLKTLHKNKQPKNVKKFFDNVLKEMKNLYEIGLIHGDLSSFNILNYNDTPVLIDFSQSTLVRTPNSEELLDRDVKNILHYFKKFGISQSEEEVLNKIRGN